MNVYYFELFKGIQFWFLVINNKIRSSKITIIKFIYYELFRILPTFLSSFTPYNSQAINCFNSQISRKQFSHDRQKYFKIRFFKVNIFVH